MLDADSGLGGRGANPPITESSVEIFEKRTQTGLSELRKTIKEALEGASNNEEILQRIMALAQERVHSTKANLDTLQEGLEDEGQRIKITLGEGVIEAIHNLGETGQNHVREAVEKFEEETAKAVYESASLTYGSAKEEPDPFHESAEDKIARLEAEIKALEEKKIKRQEKTGVKSLVRENKKLEDLRKELTDLRGVPKEGASKEVRETSAPAKELPLTASAVLDLLKGIASGYESRRKTAQGEIDNLNKKTDLSDQERTLLRRWDEEAQDVRIRQARLVAELAKKPGVDQQLFEDAWQQMGGKESFEEILDLAASESMGERDRVAMEASVDAARRANLSGHDNEGRFDPASMIAERVAKQGAMNEAQQARVMDQAGKFIEQIEDLKSKISTARRDVDTLAGVNQRIKKNEIERLTNDLAERERALTEFVKTSERSGVVIDVDSLKESLRDPKSVTPPDTVSSPTPEPPAPGPSPVDQTPAVEPDPVDEQAKKREELLAKIRDNTEKLEALRAKRGAKDKPGALEALLDIRLGQLRADLAKLDSPSDVKTSTPLSPDTATTLAKDTVPDPAPPAPPAAPPSPDVAATKPDASIKLDGFEQRLRDDENRLNSIDVLIKGWKVSESTAADASIKAWANWYNNVVSADKELAQAPDQKARAKPMKRVLSLLKAEPTGDASWEKTQEAVDAFLASATTPEQKSAGESRKAILALIAEGRAAQGLKPLDAKAPATPTASTPDTAAPDAQPSPDATPDPDPVVPTAEGPAHGPKTLQEAFDHEDALFRRLLGGVGKLETVAGLDDAPLNDLLLRAGESLQVFERLVKESDANEQMKLAAERAAFLESTEAQKSVEACFDNLYAAIGSLSPIEVKSETGFTARVEALTLLSELFPAVNERLPPLKKTLQETLALAPPGKEPEKTPQELLERDRGLISRLEKLALASHAVGDLDTPNPDQEYGELDRVMLGVHAAVELLELANQEEDVEAREKLRAEYSIILKDPKIQESAEAYMEKISDLLRTMEPDAVRADAQIRNRIETLEVLAEIFPDLAKKIPTLKTQTEQAGLVSLGEREAWQAEIDEMGLRIAALQKTLEAAKDDKWYQENKASVDAGLAFRVNFQAGLTERVKTLLAAKTFAERRIADEEIVKFRREFALTPPPALLPEASIAKVKIKIKELEKEAKIIKDEQGKKAAQEKQAELEALNRYALILELQKDIRREAALQSLPSDAEIIDRQARAREENVFKKEGEIKAPESIDGIRLGMQNNSEKQLAETTSAVRVARETQAFFSEALAGFKPHPEIGERFSPIYATWQEEQEAHFELLDKERHYNFLDHLEIGVTQALRSLDRLGSGSLSPEAAQAMWEGFPGVVRKLLAKGGEGDFASSLAPEDRNVETIKGWLYESLRKTTQDKLVTGQTLETALANADAFTGKTERLAAETRAQLEREMTALEQEHKRLEMELQQKQPGGVSHKEVRWSQEGARLQFTLMVAEQKMARLKDQHKDLLDIEEIFNDSHGEDPSTDDKEGYLALELKREPSERMVVIMQRQNERTTALSAQDAARTDALKANPDIMAKAIITSASGKKSVEAKSNNGGGGKSESGSLLNDLKNSWAARLAKPFTDLFSGWFGGK